MESLVNLYVRGWLHYDKLSSTYSEVKDLAEWVRRRVRLYYWKQWSRSEAETACRRQPVGRAQPGNQPRTRRRNLLALGVDPGKVHMATRSRKGYWRMSQNELVRNALNNRWLEVQGVPDMNAMAAVAAFSITAKPCLMDAAKRSQSRMDCFILRAESPRLIGTALYGAVRRVVWDPWLI